MCIDYSSNLLKNVHENVPAPEAGETFLVRGDYEYWHYCCDGFNDRGWGCGYRTLQTICSWIRENKKSNAAPALAPVPTIPEIQQILVDLDDKERSFAGSREWIGSFEVCLVLDQRYEVLSKIVHIPKGKDLNKYVGVVRTHFQEFGSPAMMGGDRDCSSKGIAGIHFGSQGTYLLVLDPHFVGVANNAEQLQNHLWVKWQNVKDFVDSSFYNLCFPQMKFINKPKN